MAIQKNRHPDPEKELGYFNASDKCSRPYTRRKNNPTYRIFSRSKRPLSRKTDCSHLLCIGRNEYQTHHANKTFITWIIRLFDVYVYHPLQPASHAQLNNKNF